MNESQHNIPKAYQTGPTTPPKSHGGAIAFLLVAVIFICGIASIMSILHIPVLQLVENSEENAIHLLSETHPQEQTMLCLHRPNGHGISGQDISNVLRNYYDLPQGIYITHVDTSSDFYTKGLRSGDILLDLNGKSLPDMATLEEILDNSHREEQVHITFYRNGKHHKATVILNEGA